MVALLIFFFVAFIVLTIFRDLFRLSFVLPVIAVGLAALFFMHA